VDKLKNAIFTVMPLFIMYEGMGGYFSAGFNINKYYFSSVLSISIIVSLYFLIQPVYFKYKKKLEEDEKLKGTYPPNFPLESLKSISPFSEFKEFVNVFNAFFLFCCYLFLVIFLYSASYTMHKYIVPFANYVEVKVTPITYSCSGNDTVRTCSLYLLSEEKERIVLSTSISLAKEISSKKNSIIEFKNSFIGSSPVNYK
jgi:hypothetical protein